MDSPDTILDQIDIATAGVFLETFGEEIWYLPRIGGKLKITAIVNRGGREIQAEPRARRRPVTIEVKPDSGEGIDPDSFTTMDEIVVRTSETGAEQVTLRLTRIVDGNNSGLVIYEAA